MVTKKSWNEFRSTGLLFAANQFLHFFGWAIVFSFDEQGELIEVYPARVKFRGFDEKSTDEGYKQVTEYVKENIEELSKEI